MALAPVAAAMAIGGSLIQGVAAIKQGDAQANAAKAEGAAQQQQLARDAQYTQIAAAQSETARLEDLQRTQGVITATLAGRNLDLSSPSAVALSDAADTYAQRNIMRERFTASQQIANDNLTGQTAMAMANFKAKMARNAGYMGAASSLLKAAGEGNSFFNTPADPDFVTVTPRRF